MASASFILSNHFLGTAFSAADVVPSSPATKMSFRQQQPVRISASYTATAERPSTYHIGSQTSLYEVLGVHKGATCQEIKTAYRRLARVLHPDVASNNGREDISTAANDFMEVHKAYVTLSDPEKRADYDRILFRQRRPCPSVLSPSTTYSAGYTRRNWETDQCW